MIMPVGKNLQAHTVLDKTEYFFCSQFAFCCSRNIPQLTFGLYYVFLQNLIPQDFSLDRWQQCSRHASREQLITENDSHFFVLLDALFLFVLCLLVLFHFCKRNSSGFFTSKRIFVTVTSFICSFFFGSQDKFLVKPQVMQCLYINL